MEIITGIERRRRWRPEEKLRIVAEKLGDGIGMLNLHQQRMLCTGAVVLDQRQFCAGDGGLDGGFDLLKGRKRHGGNL